MKKYDTKTFSQLRNCILEPLWDGIYWIYKIVWRWIYELVWYIEKKHLIELVKIKNKLTYQSLNFKSLK